MAGSIVKISYFEPVLSCSSIVTYAIYWEKKLNWFIIVSWL